ncbi:class III lanthionine synthetase LanKC [Amycolatopsis sp. NBC_00345]|uniref:class III lanthionine synthetase LanKC n=1 Tax=Amycolatopsis sp. NBC_00345 TaxID=2975955 RepID=UPI002E27096F
MDDYLLFCQNDGDFYDHPSVRAVTPFATVTQAPPEGWVREEDAYWAYFTPADAQLPEQGWKIHVSAVVDEAEEVIGLVARHCFEERVSFKVQPSRQAYLLSNGKYAPRGGSGKLITIYTGDDDQLRSTLDALSNTLRGRRGPYILSDLRWLDGPLYVRYGGFSMMYCANGGGQSVPAVRRPDGTLVPDLRGPTFSVPDWVRVPGFVAEQIEKASVGTVKMPYRVDKVLHFSNGGGIYLGRGEQSDKPVVLREARPFAGLDGSGQDAVTRLRHEADVLAALSDLDFTPGFVTVFTAWEHHFLVEDYIEGDTLWTFMAKRNPLPRGRHTADEVTEYTERALSILIQLEAALQTLHRRGYVFADLHPKNIIIGADDRVTLIDFEISYRPADEPAPTIGAPGFVAAHAWEGPERDIYALNAIRLAVFLPLTAMLDFDAAKVDDLADAATVLFPKAADVVEQARLGIAVPDDPTAGSPTLSHRFGAAARDQHGPDMRALQASVLAGILRTATPDRADRLFPGDPAGLRDGGYNLAYGASGVLVTFLLIGHPVDPRQVEWLRSATERSPARGGLYTGMHGAAIALHALGETNAAHDLLDRITADTPPQHSLSLFGGLAGIGLAVRYFAHQTGDAHWQEVLDNLTARVAGELAHEAPQSPVPGEPTRSGLMFGRTGAALFCLRRYQDTGDSALLDATKKALDDDSAHLDSSESGGVVLSDGVNSLSHLSIGSAGLAMPIDLYLRYRTDERLTTLRRGITDACGAVFTAESGLFLGRAGLMTALAAGSPDETTARMLAAHVRRLAWHAVRRDGTILFPGSWLLKLSADLTTGSSGVLLALRACELAAGAPPDNTTSMLHALAESIAVPFPLGHSPSPHSPPPGKPIG